MKQVKFEIFGMKCEGCTNTVKVTLEKYPGVKNVTVNLMPGEAIVTYQGDYPPADLMKHLEKNTQYKALVKTE